MTALSAADVVSEAEFQATVIEMARALGWRVHAERTGASKSGRWSTPVQGNPGWPDLCLVRERVLLFMELKRESTRAQLTTEQKFWLMHLNMVPGVTAALFRPSDMPTIRELLT